MLELGQFYQDGLCHHVETNQDEWEHERSRRFAQHIMAAVAFRESTQSIIETTKSVILAPIGFYYSLFHLSIAALTIDYRMGLESLTKMRHSRLINLMKTQMLNSGLVSPSYISILERLKNEREYANYQFGIHRQGFPVVSREYYQDTEVCFQDVTEFFHSVNEAIEKINQFGFRVRVGIADGYGDDVLQEYLSEEHKLRVNDWLADNGLQF